MLYQQLRPRTLDEVVGNKATVAGLRTVLASDDKPHVFLFTGPSGCGKTTLARILATELGCDVIDFIEMNAAQTRGIDAIRELERIVALRPWGGKARLVLMDEAHMLTTAAQNCLLKILEDIPKHQYFALSSTDPDRIIATIRNRCALYVLKLLRPPEMKQLLENSVEKLREQSRGTIDIEPEVLELIRSAAEGSPRQALIMLEQVMDMDAEEALESLASGVVIRRGTKDLCQCLMKGYRNGGDAFKILSKIEGEPEQIRRAVVGYLAVVVSKKGITAVDTPTGRALNCFLRADTFRNGKAALVGAILQFCSDDNRL